MSSIHCPDCSTEVTSSERTCPRCNFPISKLRGLSAAILTKNAERVAGLIQLGADVNATDTNGRTPLITAALMDDPKIVQMLLAAGARPEFVTAAGETALSVAKSREVERLIRRAIVLSKFKRTQIAPSSEVLPQRPTEEPTLRFDDTLMFIEASPSENHNADQSRPIDAIPEPALDFEQSMKFTDAAAWEKRSLETKESFEPQIAAEDPIEIIGISQVSEVHHVDLQVQEEQPSVDLSYQEFTRQKRESFEPQITAEDPIEIIEISQVDEAPPVNLQVQAERPSVDFSYQQFTPHHEPRYFFAAITGASLLIMFMLLTWPGNFTAPAPHTTQPVKPAKQITKPPVEKPEPPPIQKSEIIVPEEHLTVDENPPPQVNNTTVVKKRKRYASTIGDEDKIRLARALNNQGFSLIKQGRHGEAIAVLERSLRTFPKGTKDVYYAYALFNLGVAWRKAGRPDIAIPILEKRMKIENQRDIVARELSTARQQAIEAGFQR